LFVLSSFGRWFLKRKVAHSSRFNRRGASRTGIFSNWEYFEESSLGESLSH
jgi:hypothetical protein